MKLSQEKLIELTAKAIPFPAQITDIDLRIDTPNVRFSWNGHRFAVTQDLDVDEVLCGSVLAGTTTAVLLRELLQLHAKQIQE